MKFHMKGLEARLAANKVATSMCLEMDGEKDRRLGLCKPVLEWFRSKGWAPFKFQRESWEAYLEGKSGLIHAPTGIGKTYAAWLGTVMEWMADERPYSKKPPESAAPPMRVLWVTPLRALATDLSAALLNVVEDLELPWSVECRTGDTSAAVRTRQKNLLPTALVTTPGKLESAAFIPWSPGKIQKPPVGGGGRMA